MKYTKKFFALVLALMMAFTTLVLPAAAVAPEDEGIMPLYELSTCPVHGVAERVTVSTGHGILSHVVCSNYPGIGHKHFVNGSPIYMYACGIIAAPGSECKGLG